MFECFPTNIQALVDSWWSSQQHSHFPILIRVRKILQCLWCVDHNFSQSHRKCKGARFGDPAGHMIGQPHPIHQPRKCSVNHNRTSTPKWVGPPYCWKYVWLRLSSSTGGKYCETNCDNICGWIEPFKMPQKYGPTRFVSCRPKHSSTFKSKY